MSVLPTTNITIDSWRIFKVTGEKDRVLYNVQICVYTYSHGQEKPIVQQWNIEKRYTEIRAFYNWVS